MGAIPVLIMLAAVGVDYGWQPDGTSSQRGDHVEYIIQIPPDQLEHVSSLGEITSAIDPSIQGRVSKVVVRIGTGPLPRDSGRGPVSDNRRAGAASAVAQAVAVAEDQRELPIPELREDSLAQAAPRAAGRFGEARGLGEDRAAWNATAMMPVSHDDGFSLPAGAVGANPAVSTDPIPAAERTQPPVAATAPPRRPAEASGDPAPSMAFPPRSPSAQGGEAQSRAASGTRPTDPSDPNWSGYGTTRNFGALPPGLAPTTEIARPQESAAPATQAQAGTQQTPGSPAATATANAAGGAAGGSLDPLGRPLDNLGRLIDHETGRLIDAAGNWVDELGRRLDQHGRLLSQSPGSEGATAGNANLQTPSRPAPAADPAGYGRQYGQTPTMPWASSPGQTSNQPPYSQPGYGQPTYASPGYGQPAHGTAPQPAAPGAVPGGAAGPGGVATPPAYAQQPGYPAGTAQPGAAQPPNAAAPVTAPYQQHQQPVAAAPVAYPPATVPSTGLPTARESVAYTSPPAASDPRPSARELARQRDGFRDGFDEDEFLSPSDRRTEGSARQRWVDQDDSLASSGAAGGSKDRRKTVAAQPFFNFVLLISLVGNAYLIYETGNLRRKFRDMIASVRASKLSTQPAN